MVKKPELDDETVRIARRMLSTPPKPHGDMKIGARKAKLKVQKRRTKVATPSR
jgi:hypothetical protein